MDKGLLQQRAENPVAFAAFKEGETVLDLGSGGGIDVFLTPKRVRPKGKVIGIDVTEVMIKRAKSTAKNTATKMLSSGWVK